MTLEGLVRAGRREQAEAARLLRVADGAVRYPLRRPAARAVDGPAQQATLAASLRPAIDAYLAAVGEKAPSNVTDTMIGWLPSTKIPAACGTCSEIRVRHSPRRLCGHVSAPRPRRVRKARAN